jgi:hypothetical protein
MAGVPYQKREVPDMATYKITYAVSDVRVAFIDVDRHESPAEVFEREYNRHGSDIPTCEMVEIEHELRHVEPTEIEISVEGEVSKIYSYRTLVTVSAKAYADALAGDYSELLFENSEVIANSLDEDMFDCHDVKVSDIEYP